MSLETVAVWLPAVLSMFGLLAVAAAAIVTVLGARHSHLSGLIRDHVERLQKGDNGEDSGLQKNLMVQIWIFRGRNIMTRTSMTYAYKAFISAVLAAIVAVFFFLTAALVPVHANDEVASPSRIANNAAIAAPNASQEIRSSEPKQSWIWSIFFGTLGVILAIPGIATLYFFVQSLRFAAHEFQDSTKTLDLEIYSLRDKQLPATFPFPELYVNALERSLSTVLESTLPIGATPSDNIIMRMLRRIRKAVS